jgi:hypothetical protein
MLCSSRPPVQIVPRPLLARQPFGVRARQSGVELEDSGAFFDPFSPVVIVETFFLYFVRWLS